jgi:hypothetical protein
MIGCWVGPYHHDEFATTYLFMKHRPIWKWSCYSPIGRSDAIVDDLRIKQREEQQLFEESVSSRGLSK